MAEPAAGEVVGLEVDPAPEARLARLKVEWPEMNPWNASVTKVLRWYGTQIVAGSHCTPAPGCQPRTCSVPLHTSTTPGSGKRPRESVVAR